MHMQPAAPAGHATPAAPAAPLPRPFVGEIQSIVPGQELVSKLVLDLGRHPFLSQHALLNVPADLPLELKPMAERLVTLPMTFEQEILSEVAETLMPGLLVTSCHSMEAKRWVALEGAATLEIEIRARRLTDREVQVEIYTPGQKDPAFRGRATMDTSLPLPPAQLEQAYDRLCPHTPAEFYATGPLFHGPMFQLMRNFIGMSDTHIGAHLVASGPEEHLGLPAHMVFEPLLLDALQQIVGYRGWLDGWFLMPVGMKRLTRYGPPPEAGSDIRASVVYRRLDGRRVEADYEAHDSEGRLWVRVEGLQAWRVLSPKALLEANHRPREGYLAKPWDTIKLGPVDSPAVCCHVKADYLGGLPHEWIARLYLRPGEWAMYRQRPALDWLLGRVAAKDAVRGWFRDHRKLLLHPLEVEIANEPDGSPVVNVPAAPSLALSIAHIENEAVAIAGEAAGLGVDLAEVKDRNSGFAGFAFRADELASFPARSQNAWIHRGWCAKEAAAKAVRLGLGELPRFRIVAVDIEAGWIEMEFEGKRLRAATWLEGDRTLAVVVR
jgi:phosphopantetheinyl transferase (holo-ACP synthase)